MGHGSDDASALGRREFLTTRWSVVRAAGGGDEGAARDALASLCASYWYPLYGYARRRGVASEDARDLTQAFFARLLEKRDVGGADPASGRFRAWLLASMKHFLANERDRERALKRGGGVEPVAIDAREADSRYALDPAHELTPERAFERDWARALLARALERVREEYELGGRGAVYAALAGAIGGDVPAVERRAAAELLGLSPGALDVALHRLRRRFRAALRAEIAGTVSDPGEVEAELADLFAALAG